MKLPTNPRQLIIAILILAGLSLIPGLKLRDARQIEEQVLGALTQTASPPGYYRVTQVIDGDTIKVTLEGREETVRLLSIDTPETKAPGQAVECYGPEASQHLTDLLTNQSVRLEVDSLQGDRDRYGRLLRYLYLPDGTFVNALMVQQGFARIYSKTGSDQLEYIRTLESAARASHLGLWGQCTYAN